MVYKSINFVHIDHGKIFIFLLCCSTFNYCLCFTLQVLFYFLFISFRWTMFFPKEFQNNSSYIIIIQTFWGFSRHLLKLVSAIFHYFWKNNVLLGYFEGNTLKRNLTCSCFIIPLFHEHLFSPELSCAPCLLKTCFEKITVCVIETMLVTLPLV